MTQTKKLLMIIFGAVFLTACGGSSSTTSISTSSSIKILAAGNDFSDPNGLIFALTENGTQSTKVTDTSGTALTTYQDAIVRSYGNKFYVFGRDSNGAVIVLNNDNTSQTPIANYSLAELDPAGNFNIDGGFNGTNPYDIEFVSESKAFVCFWNSNYILEINPLTGERISSIDVSFIKNQATASDASSPNVNDIEIINNKLYILAQRLNSSFTPLESTLNIFDIASNSFVDLNTATAEIDGIVLTGKNPSVMSYAASTEKLYIGHKGNIQYAADFSVIESIEANTAGIEAIDLTSNTTEGLIISGTVLSSNGDNLGVKNLLFSEDAKKYYVVYENFDFTQNLIELNLSEKSIVGSAILSTNSSAFGASVIDKSGFIYQIERNSTNPGINKINPGNGQIVFTATEVPLQDLSVID